MSEPQASVGVFAAGALTGFEQVAHFSHPPSGLRAIVAIHSTVLGPALGGTRFHPYRSEGEALADVLRLARAMTYKHAVAGLDHGGGKAVILGDPAELRSEPLLRAYARFIDGLGGRYLTAEDVGTTRDDMDLLRSETCHVTGVSESLGGSGDPSPATAWGVLAALRTVASRRFGASSLAGLHVAVAGVGKVGGALCDHLAAEGARLTVADVDSTTAAAVAERTGAAVVAPECIHATPCDVFAPCALGGALDARTIAELDCAAVCGSANNQLGQPTDGQRLADRSVLYAPDFVVNAGGVINIAEEPRGYDRRRAFDRIARIGHTLARVLDRADADAVTPAEAADRLAEERLAGLSTVALIPTVDDHHGR
ncbi:leucine dehydrogenase [soil metagenome]